MAIIHVPRVLMSVGRGLLQARKAKNTPSASKIKSSTSGAIIPAGFSHENPALYEARVGLFDVDYLGHMNNAAFLAHAEYARWEMITANNALTTMFKTDTHFMVSGTFIRYRREIRPLFRKFTIDTYLAGLDSRNIWIVHNFRVAGTGDGGKSRIRSQLVVQAMTVHKRKVTDPRTFFLNEVGIDANVMDALDLGKHEDGTGTHIFHDIREGYNNLDTLLRLEASEDDKIHDA